MTASALERMARIGDVVPPPIDPTQILARAMERACDAGAGLDVHLCAAEAARCDFADALGQVSSDDLLIALQRGDTMIGAAALCTELRSAVVEVQALGTIRATPAEKRVASGTDAALLAPVIRGFMRECVGGAGGTIMAGLLNGVDLGARLHSTRVMELSLTDPQVNVITVSVRLAETDRVGTLRILVPDPPIEEPKRPDAQVAWHNDWPRLARSLPVRVEAVLHKMPMSLSRLNSLQPGMSLALSGADVGGMVLRDVSGGYVAAGRLGQAGGFRAVRLLPREDVTPQLEELSAQSAPDLLASPSSTEMGAQDAFPVAELNDLPDPPDILDTAPDLDLGFDPPPMDLPLP